MYTDIYKDHMYPVELFGKNALYTEGTIPREEVPDGWRCYDLCGTDQKPDKPLILTDLAVLVRKIRSACSGLSPSYTKVYPLMDWGWTREDCIAAIQQEGLPLPGKSSCFFCPSMKKREIRTLYHRHRDLYDRAIAIEDGARPNLIVVKGLGRNWTWRDFVEADLNQTAMCWMFPEDDLPCNCHDGG